MVNSTNFDLIHIPRWSQISGTFNWWGVGGGWEGGLWHGFHGEKGGWEEAVQSDRDRHCADSLWWPSRLRDPIHAPRKKKSLRKQSALRWGGPGSCMRSHRNPTTEPRFWKTASLYASMQNMRYWWFSPSNCHLLDDSLSAWETREEGISALPQCELWIPQCGIYTAFYKGVRILDQTFFSQRDLM